VHQEDPEPDQEQERQEGSDQRHPREAAGALRVVADALLLQQLLEVELGLVGRVMDVRRLPVDVLDADLALARAEQDLLDVLRVLLDVLAERRIRDARARVRVLRDQRLARQPDEQDDHDEREEGAAEEAIHNCSSVRVALWMCLWSPIRASSESPEYRLMPLPA